MAKKGFYDGLNFHRVIWICSTRWMSKWNWWRWTGYTIQCETQGGNQYHDKGVLSMAHAGQYWFSIFIVHTRQATAHLDGGHLALVGLQRV